MKKNTNYIIGLISIICISVVINGYRTKTKEGYTEMSCSNLKNAISEYFNRDPNAMINIKAINRGRDPVLYNTNDALTFTILCMSLVGIFDSVMNTYPNFFKDLFNNTEITDSDFIILKNAYNLLNGILLDLLITLLDIDHSAKSTAHIAETQQIEKIYIDNIFNGVNSNIKIVLLNLEKLVLKIQKPEDTPPVNSNDINMDGVNAMADLYFAIRNVKKCARISGRFLFSDVTRTNREEIFPFFRLIRDYIFKFANSVNKYFVPALNAKLKDGQIKIIDLHLHDSYPENANGKKVTVDESIGVGAVVGNPLLQGVGAATPS